MENVENHIFQAVKIFIQHGKVYLSNGLDEEIEQLIYETYSVLTTDDQIGVSARVCYKILNIPAKSAVYLETLDGFEDGSIYYDLAFIKTPTLVFTKKTQLKEKRLSGMINLPQLVPAKIEKIEGKEGFALDI